MAIAPPTTTPRRGGIPLAVLNGDIAVCVCGRRFITKTAIGTAIACSMTCTERLNQRKAKPCR